MAYGRSAAPGVQRLLGVPIIGWGVLWVLLMVVGGAIYTIHAANTASDGPALPAPPPHSVALVRSSKTDMLQGNFITTTALFRSSDSPARVIGYYTALLQREHQQFGRFDELATTTDPARSPAVALQQIPPIFDSPTASDKHAARYLYTEFHRGHDDLAIAVDTRQPRGPTLVYLEMLSS